MKTNHLALLFLVLIGAEAARASLVVTSTTGSAADGTMVNAILANGRVTGVSVNPGLVSLGTKDVTATVTGVQVGDTLVCSLAGSAAMTAGASMTMCSVTAANTVNFHYDTPLVAGITLGAFTYNVTWSR